MADRSSPVDEAVVRHVASLARLDVPESALPRFPRAPRWDRDPDLDDRVARLKAVRDDPEFAEVVTKQEENPDTKLVLKVHNIDMTPNGKYTAITVAK